MTVANFINTSNTKGGAGSSWLKAPSMSSLNGREILGDIWEKTKEVGREILQEEGTKIAKKVGEKAKKKGQEVLEKHTKREAPTNPNKMPKKARV